MNKLRFGIIGTNWITDSFVKGALETGLWDFTAVYSRKHETGLNFGQKYDVTNIYTDYEEMAKSSDIDAVYIASPNYMHVKQSLTFLQNGKHVICEKPAASHKADFELLVKTAEENNVVFIEAIKFMHNPARKLLESAINEIGPISMAKIDFCQRSSQYDRLLNGELPNIFNPQMETGALMDLGIYCVYPALYLFGKPLSMNISTVPLASGVDGAGSINFTYSDKIVNIPYSKLGQSASNTDIQGDFGTINIESISRLANMKICFSDGTEKEIYGIDEKHKLMGYEAMDLYRYITEPEASKEELTMLSKLGIEVADTLDQLRKKAGIKFPSDDK